MAIGDPYFDKVVLGLNFDAGLVDDSLSKRVMSAAGNAVITSSAAKYGSGGLALDGNGDYVKTQLTSDLKLSDSDFTIELWLKPNSVAGVAHLLGVWYAAGTYSYVLYRNQAGVLFSYTLNGTTQVNAVAVSTGMTAGVWAHIAVCRSGSSLKAFLNGVQVGGTHAIGTSTIYDANTPLTIGCNTSGYAPENGAIDGVRITKGVARYTANFAPPTSAPPFYAAQIQGTVKDANGNFTRRLVKAHRRSDGFCFDAVLSNPSDGTFTLKTPDTSKHYAIVHDSDAWITYLPFNGDNNSTIFPEWGGKKVTPYGNAKISTTQSKFGGASAYFDGTGDYLTLQNSNDLDFGASDFTIEFWVRFASTAGTHGVFAAHALSAVVAPYLVYLSGGNLLFYSSSDGTTWSVASAQVIKSGVAADTWYHVAVSREGSSIRLFCNGVLTTTITFSGMLLSLGQNTPSIGQWAQGNWFNGYIDDLRISKGVARYIADFTPPTVPHFTVQAGDPYWNNVVLGCHFNNGETPTFKDVATGKTLTANGNVSIVSTQSKFGGYSAYFDGNGDYLSIPDTTDFGFGTGDFTIDGWIYPLVITGSDRAITDFRSIDSSCGTFFIEGATQKLAFLNGATKLGTTGTVVTTGVWHHVALARLNGVMYCFLDGVLDWSSTTVCNFTSSRKLGIGGSTADTPGSSPFNGYIDDLRIRKGVARWVTNFTPPAAAFPEVLETYGQQNAMIFDHLTPV